MRADSQQIVLQSNGPQRLGALLGPGVTAVICSHNSYKDSSWKMLLRESLPGRVIELAGVANPNIHQVKSLTGELARCSPDRIVAVGGGSVLDLAKAARHMGQFKVPLVAVPTTAGSGSEATPYASISVLEPTTRSGYAKVSLCHQTLLPSIVCLDGDTLKTVPKKQRAISGMDVVVQSVESYWSRKATPASRADALRSVQLWVRSFPQYLAGDFDNCEELQLAAFYSGMAIAQVPTTACHAISYPLTSDFGIPHGWAVSLTFPEMVNWNSHALGETRTALCAAFGVDSLAKVVAFVENLVKSTGIPTRLSDWGISKSDIPYIVSRSYRPDRMKGTPRTVSPDDLTAMLYRLL